MKIAYIAGPYRAPTVFGVTQNIQRAREVAAEFWRMGYAVLCPHMNSALMDGVVPDGIFLTGDHEFLRRMRPGDIFVLLPDWTKSEGTKAELALAISLGLTVVLWSDVEGRARRIDHASDLLTEALA